MAINVPIHTKYGVVSGSLIDSSSHTTDPFVVYTNTSNYFTGSQYIDASHNRRIQELPSYNFTYGLDVIAEYTGSDYGMVGANYSTVYDPLTQNSGSSWWSSVTGIVNTTKHLSAHTSSYIKGHQNLVTNLGYVTEVLVGIETGVRNRNYSEYVAGIDNYIFYDAAGTTKDNYGIIIRGIDLGGNVENNYGLYIDSNFVPSNITSQSYAIYSAADVPSFFTGDIYTSGSYLIDGTNALSQDALYNMRIGPGAGSTYGSGATNIFVGRNAGANVDAGYQNVALGYTALSNASNPQAYNNIAVGPLAMSAGLGGRSNIGFGFAALRYNAGDYNVAIGYESIKDNTFGRDNLGIGYFSLTNNTTGNYNMAIGSYAGFTNITGSNNIFIGYQAGYFETGSNKLYIANSGSNPLISGDFDTRSITFAGSVEITGSNLTVNNDEGYNIFGNQPSNWHIFTGSVDIVGNLYVNGATFGDNSISASYAVTSDTASFALNAGNNITGIANWITKYNAAGDDIEESIIYQTSSTIVISGSSGINTFGSEITDVHQFTGSVSINGSLILNDIQIGDYTLVTSSYDTTMSFDNGLNNVYTSSILSGSTHFELTNPVLGKATIVTIQYVSESQAITWDSSIKHVGGVQNTVSGAFDYFMFSCINDSEPRYLLSILNE